MKKIVLVILTFCSVIAYGQKSAKDSLVKVVDQYTQAVYNAANTFLNRRLGAAERIKAIDKYTMIYDEKQVLQFNEVIQSPDQSSDIKAVALSKIYNYIITDQKLINQVFTWLGNPKTPKRLRDESLQVVDHLSFSTMTAPEIYQKLLADSNLNYRVDAFSKLIAHGDARAQQKLIAGLENPASASVPAPTAIGLLSMASKKEYYPAVYKVLQQTKDDATRLEAIRALGSYKEAREKITAISRDPKEKEGFREAALGALYAGDRDNIINYAKPILLDKTATTRLQGIAIQMTIDVRQAVSYRLNAKKADEYDLVIKNIAEGKGLQKSAELQKIANKYIRSVRPQY